ncbi:hypothetical protein JCM8208_007784 [Rhodotorula glutinis]
MMYSDLFMIGFGFLLIATRPHWYRISIFMVYSLPFLAYVAVLMALLVVVEASSCFPSRLHSLMLQPILAGAMSPFEAQELVARRLCLHDSLSEAADLLLPWHSLPWILDFSETLVLFGILWMATGPFAAIIRAHSDVSNSLRRRRVELALVVLAVTSLFICGASVQDWTTKMLDASAQMRHNAVHLYEDLCSFNNIGEIKCQVLGSAVKHRVDESAFGRVYIVYRAVKLAVEWQIDLKLMGMRLVVCVVFLAHFIEPIRV